MKKNKFMRLASVMLMLCLITTCAISGTFAKYTTSDSASDTARVAKWGLSIIVTDAESNNPAELFIEEYKNDAVIGSTAIGAGLSVNSVDDTAHVVAPGTTRKITVEIVGKPEVALKLFADVNLNLGDKWTTTGADVYCPLVFTINGTEYKIDATNDTTAKLETAVETAILNAIFAGETPVAAVTGVGGVAKSFDFTPNNDNLAVSEFDIEWEWPFVGDDVKDTILGNTTAGNIPTVGFDLVIRADQID